MTDASTGSQAPRPSFFLAVFGEPGRPGKDPVESGSYTPDPAYAPFDTRPGDLIVLYCTAKYPGLDKSSPGVGLGLETTDVVVRYRCLPFVVPIRKIQLDDCLDSDDATSFRRIHLPKYWLFKLSQQSFSRVLNGAAVD